LIILSFHLKVRPIFHLSLADLVASIGLLFGSIAYMKYGFNSTSRKFCSYLTAISSTFSHIYCLYSFAWIAPLAVTLCLFAIDSGETGKGSLNDDICGTCLPVFHYRNSNCSVSKSLEQNIACNINRNNSFCMKKMMVVEMMMMLMMTMMMKKMTGDDDDDAAAADEDDDDNEDDDTAYDDDGDEDDDDNNDGDEDDDNDDDDHH
ncbi:hypothetical protein QZH41_009726, partial [Actinostola sp. cb2023]